ncbi:MAG: GntR family transcriptional regulator [Propioniciclava sp.]
MSDVLADLAPLPRESLRDRALETLRPAIISGEIPPGTHLSEVALSKSLAISRGTLREALSVLEREGLAVSDARGRTRVPDLTPEVIRQVFQVREALEAMAVYLVIQAGKVEEATQALRVRLEQMRVSQQSGTLVEQVGADMAFHRTLCEASDNRPLVQAWNDMAGRVSMSILYSGEEKAVGNMAPERHQEVIDALNSRSTAVAIKALHRHFEVALARLLRDYPISPAEN